MNPADKIFKLALEIHRTLRHRFVRTGKTPWQINPLQLFALVILNDNPDITMRELAELLKITSPSATSFVDRLSKYGWVKRKPDEKNRKLVRLHITKEGEKILENHLRDKNHFMNHLMGLMPLEDQKDLARIFKNLLHQLSKH